MAFRVIYSCSGIWTGNSEVASRTAQPIISVVTYSKAFSISLEAFICHRSAYLGENLTFSAKSFAFVLTAGVEPYLTMSATRQI